MQAHWTPERDERLKQLCKSGCSTAVAGDELGVTRHSIKNRASRLGITFSRSPARIAKAPAGHRAFTPRCAELLGWRI